MKLSKNVLMAIRNIQAKNNSLLLCGSGALIMSGLLDNRDMHDVDFVINRRDLSHSNIKGMSLDTYGTKGIHSTYDSFSGDYIHDGKKLSGVHFKLNILLFDDDMKLNSETFTHGDVGAIKHQKIDDIIKWKKLYDRPKDHADIDNISYNLIQKAISDTNV